MPMKYAWHKNVYNVECFLVSGIFHGHFAQRLAVNKPCLQIVRRLLWKQTTTHSIRNNNPIFDREEPLVKQIRPTVYSTLDGELPKSPRLRLEIGGHVYFCVGRNHSNQSHCCSKSLQSVTVEPNMARITFRRTQGSLLCHGVDLNPNFRDTHFVHLIQSYNFVQMQRKVHFGWTQEHNLKW